MIEHFLYDHSFIIGLPEKWRPIRIKPKAWVTDVMKYFAAVIQSFIISMFEEKLKEQTISYGQGADL